MKRREFKKYTETLGGVLKNFEYDDNQENEALEKIEKTSQEIYNKYHWKGLKKVYKKSFRRYPNLKLLIHIKTNYER